MIQPSTRTPELAEVIRNAIEAATSETYTAVPAAVVKVSGRRVDVQPLVDRGYLDEEGVRRTERLPVVPSCPVLWPGGGGFTLTFPLSDGGLVIEGVQQPASTGMLVISTVSLDAWLASTGQAVDPGIDHHHALHDGMFVPELRPFGALGAAPPADHAFLGADGGVGIHFRDQIVCVGDEAGADFVALAGAVLSELRTISNAFAKHSHGPGSFTTAGGGPVTGTSGESSDYNPGGVAARQAKAQ